MVYSSNNILGLVTTDFVSFSNGMKHRPNSENITIVSNFEDFVTELSTKIYKLK